MLLEQIRRTHNVEEGGVCGFKWQLLMIVGSMITPAFNYRLRLRWLFCFERRPFGKVK